MAEWAQVLCRVLSMGYEVPWERYQPWLVEEVVDDKVDYKAFIARYDVRLREQYSGWQRTVLQMFYNSLRRKGKAEGVEESSMESVVAITFRSG